MDIKWFQTFFQYISREFVSNHNVIKKMHMPLNTMQYLICDILSSYFESMNCLVRMLTVKNEFSHVFSSTQMLQASRPRYH